MFMFMNMNIICHDYIIARMACLDSAMYHRSQHTSKLCGGVQLWQNATSIECQRGDRVEKGTEVERSSDAKWDHSYPWSVSNFSSATATA